MGHTTIHYSFWACRCNGYIVVEFNDKSVYLHEKQFWVNMCQPSILVGISNKI